MGKNLDLYEQALEMVRARFPDMAEDEVQRLGWSMYSDARMDTHADLDRQAKVAQWSAYGQVFAQLFAGVMEMEARRRAPFVLGPRAREYLLEPGRWEVTGGAGDSH